MESEWVRIMPFLEKPIPPIAVNTDFPGVKESKEIYDYFNEVKPDAPIDAFRDFYSNLPMTPKIGQSKFDQIMEAVRLRKLADNIKRQMDEMGIKY